MKMISLIPSYHPNMETLSKVVAELSKVSAVYIFSPDQSVERLANWIKCDASLGHNLVFEPRKWVKQNIDLDFDYVLYNEDDILIHSDQLLHVVELQSTLPMSYTTGFLRYEWYNSERRFIDMHPAHSVHTGGNGVSDVLKKVDQNWFRPWNVHSGNFLLSKQQIEWLMFADRWDTFFGERDIRYCGCLESGATSVYRSFKKVLPINYSDVAVEHMATKYGYTPNTPNDIQMNALLS